MSCTSVAAISRRGLEATSFEFAIPARKLLDFCGCCFRTAPFIGAAMKRTVTKSIKRKARTQLPVSSAQRRRMEAELREAEERVALSALDALSAQIAILDGQGKIL